MVCLKLLDWGGGGGGGGSFVGRGTIKGSISQMSPEENPESP
jgi:hypothetical protein